MAVDQHHAGGGHVQGQPQHGGKQQNRGERRKLQWFAGANRDHDHHQADHDVEGEQDVQQQGRQWHHQHRHDQQHQNRQTQTSQIVAGKVLSDG